MLPISHTGTRGRERECSHARARHRANWLSVSAERNFKAQSFGRIQPRNSTRIIRRLAGPFLHTLASRDREWNKRSCNKRRGIYVPIRAFYFVDLKKCRSRGLRKNSVVFCRSISPELRFICLCNV